MPENGSFANCCEAGGRALREGGGRPSGNLRPPWVAPALSAVLVFTTVMDVLGNLLIILAVLRNRKLRNYAGNLFLVSLALADLVVALYPYPLILMAIFHDGWSLGEAHCKASAFVMGLSVICSVFNITAIAINRYCYVCHSVAYPRIYGPWHTLLYVCLIWLLAMVALVPTFFTGSLAYDPRIYSCTFIQTASVQYTVAVVAVHFLVPMAVVSFCYLRIWVLVLRARRKARSESRLHLRPNDVQGFLTMFVVFVIFAICWAPLNCIGLAVAISPEEMAPRVPEGLFVTSYFLAYFNSCLNAIIYGLLNQNFRREYKKIAVVLWNPWFCSQDTPRDSHATGQQGQALPTVSAQHPIQGDTCLDLRQRPSDKLRTGRRESAPRVRSDSLLSHPAGVTARGLWNHPVDTKPVCTLGSGWSGDTYGSRGPCPSEHGPGAGRHSQRCIRDLTRTRSKEGRGRIRKGLGQKKPILSPGLPLKPASASLLLSLSPQGWQAWMSSC